MTKDELESIALDQDVYELPFGTTKRKLTFHHGDIFVDEDTGLVYGLIVRSKLNVCKCVPLIPYQGAPYCEIHLRCGVPKQLINIGNVYGVAESYSNNIRSTFENFVRILESKKH